jgi:hypothetical protein
MRKLLVAASLFALAATASADPQAKVVLVNINAPGVGLNDPTVVAPVPGNPMTTLGAQRMFALQHAANIWASQLRSKPPIRIQVAFAARNCNATAAVLASAGALWVDLNFKHAPVADTWYHGALVNKLVKSDIAPESDEIQAIFNINLGAPGCFTGSPFYYGTDGNEGTGVDLVATALHEFAHGLGFSQFASVTSGALFLGAPDIYNRHLLDTTLGTTWDTMTNAQRVASAVNTGNVVWTGERVTAAAPARLAFPPSLRVNSPASIAGHYVVGTAAFGPPPSDPGVTGDAVLAVDASDAAGLSINDGCSAITNDVAGKLAMIVRGTCGFAIKAKNAQNAGAIGVIIINNAAGPAPGLGGADPTIVIPTVSLSNLDGATIANTPGPVHATIGLNDSAPRAGTNADGRVKLYTPNPVAPGSTISHWDISAFPNLLMEPAINTDLNHSLDLTYPLFLDIGWLDEESRE